MTIPTLSRSLTVPRAMLAFLATLNPRPQARQGWLSPAALNGPILYVSDFSKNVVNIYAQYGRNQQPIGQISAGLFRPSGIAVDNYENLYVANANDTVLMFPKGKLTASKTYKAGIWSPFGVAVGNDGTVYVSNTRNNANGFVSEYRKGCLEPSMTITDFAGGIPLGLTTDEKNNLLVTYINSANVGQVNKYAPGSKTGKNLGIILKTPYFLTLDGKDDFVIAQNRASAVAPLAMGHSTAQRIYCIA